MGWIFLVIGLIIVGSRVAWWVRVRAWIATRKGVKDRMEAEILYNNWRRSGKK